MNCFTLTIVRHPTRSKGWLVILEWIMDLPATNYGSVKKGQKLARHYKYRAEADECASVAYRSLSEAPTFAPIAEVWPEHAEYTIMGASAFIIPQRSTPGASIEHIRNQIAHRCDGPLTAFVLISRAIELVPKGYSLDAVKNALYEELKERGMLNTDDRLVEIPGS